MKAPKKDVVRRRLVGNDLSILCPAPIPQGCLGTSYPPGIVQVIIQKDRWKQAELERPAGLQLLDDLPGAEVLFVGVGADEVEVELIGKGLGEEFAAAGERFQIEELIFDEAVDGFHIALESVGGGRDADMLAVA